MQCRLFWRSLHSAAATPAEVLVRTECPQHHEHDQRLQHRFVLRGLQENCPRLTHQGLASEVHFDALIVEWHLGASAAREVDRPQGLQSRQLLGTSCAEIANKLGRRGPDVHQLGESDDHSIQERLHVLDRKRCEDLRRQLCCSALQAEGYGVVVVPHRHPIVGILPDGNPVLQRVGPRLLPAFLKVFLELEGVEAGPLLQGLRHVAEQVRWPRVDAVPQDLREDL
mmetsp:Transcript_121992/g.352428  ORF Transcript_121992/g.352428 Transcript_121992/m.352428 type:complete len:226 (+) Transcript_121992:901-1578(+)